MKYKGLFYFFSLLLATLPLTGCWDRTEINDLGIVLAAGIDKKEDKTVELSVQILIPRSVSLGGQGSGGENLTIVRSASGANIADATARLQLRLPRRLFFGHTKVFVFGEKLAKAGIRDQFDFLIRYPEIPTRAYMFVSKKDAKEMLSLTPPLEKYSGEVLREMSILKNNMNVTLKEMQQMFRDESEGANLPLIDTLPLESVQNKETVPSITGIAVFKKDKMVGLIEGKVASGIVWIKDKMKTTTITMEPSKTKGFMSAQLLQSHTELIPQIKEGEWIIHVKTVANFRLIQNGTDLVVSSKYTPKLEKEFERDIDNCIVMSVNQVQKKYKVDIFGFGEAFNRKYPKKWDKVKDRWNEFFPKIKIKTETKVYVRRKGMITWPGGVPEEEVKGK